MEPDVLRVFAEPVLGRDGTSYAARICGRSDERGRWHGWIEFSPEEGGAVLRSPRETIQPSRRILQGWADRLRRVYMEGALERTLRIQEPKRAAVPSRPAGPRFPGPAPDPGSPHAPTPDDAALNPFLRYRRGEATLRRELHELAPAELRIVARVYRVGEDDGLDVDRLTGDELAELILRTVRERILR